MSETTALVVPGAALPAAREVIQRAEAQIAEAFALLATDPFAGLQKAIKAQKAMKIYGRVAAEAKMAGRIGNTAAATRMKAERVAGQALQAIDREQGKRTDRCYLLPFELLRLAAMAHLPTWKTLRDDKGRRCYPLDAQNPGYVTRNCAVAWPLLRTAIADQEERAYGGSGLTLPTPTICGRQAVFEWTVEDR